jgi:hypothetical protein
MKADRLEWMWQARSQGIVARPSMYLTGSTLTRMAREAGHRLKETSEGQPIKPDEIYFVSEKGVFLIE